VLIIYFLWNARFSRFFVRPFLSLQLNPRRLKKVKILTALMLVKLGQTIGLKKVGPRGRNLDASDTQKSRLVFWL